MDTIKSLAVITLLGAVLYGVYIVASKPEKPLSPEIEAAARQAESPPLIDDGSRASLSPPVITAAAQDLSAATQVSTSTSEPPVDPITGSRSPYVDPNVQGATKVEPTTRSAAETAPASSDQPSGSPPPADERDAEIAAAKVRIQRYAFEQTWKTAKDQVDEGRYREALLALTPFYNDPTLPKEYQEYLAEWLDALAAKVVYSTENLLEPPYIVSRHETLYSISEKYRVPYLLLKNINGVRDPELLVPGTRLKVVPGPFHAEVDLKRGEITVFVQNLYAGRFPFSLGDEPARPGEYVVISKDHKKRYPSAQGVLEHDDPRNPYGGVWINLNNEVCIHGSPSEAYAGQKLGCIGLAQRDAEDLFAILSEKDSKVVIKE